jgi:hypothetical protein
VDDATVVMHREADGETFLVVVRLEGAGAARISLEAAARPVAVLTTEDSRYAPDPAPIELRPVDGGLSARFTRPGAVVLAVSQSA